MRSKRSAALAIGLCFGALTLLTLSRLLPVRSSVRDQHSVLSADSATQSSAIRCLADGTTSITQSELAASKDGVHVLITDELSGGVLFLLPSHESAYDTFEAALDEGSSTLVLPLPPGRVQVGCFTEPFDPSAVDTAALATIKIDDPDAYWGTPILDCADPVEKQFRGLQSIAPEAGGGIPNLEVIVRTWVSGVAVDDALQRAFYPQATVPGTEGVVVVRNGRAIARVEMVSHDGATSFIPPLTLTTCEDSGIG
jgi:hypothetical protein